MFFEFNEKNIRQPRPFPRQGRRLGPPQGFYTKNSLHKGAFYTQKILHREDFTLRIFCTQTSRSFYTQKFLHEEIFTQRVFYTQTRLHTEAFTQRSLYIEEHLHTKAATLVCKFRWLQQRTDSTNTVLLGGFSFLSWDDSH